MLKNYIKVAFRNLAKNKLVSFINIVGLSAAVGVSIVVFTFIHFEYNADWFHENREAIYLVGNTVERDGTEQVWGDSPTPIGAMLRQDYPQLKYVVRIANKSMVFKYEDQVFTEYTRFVDPEFMKMFTFPVKYGNIDALEDKSRIIISSILAEKYFGDENPVGEQVTLNYGPDKVRSYIVGAVAEPFDKMASFNFSVLSHWDNKEAIFPDEESTNWSSFIAATFIQFNDPSDISTIENGMGKYIALQNAVEEDWPAKAYPLHPFATLSLDSYTILGDLASGSEPTGRIVLTTIALFILVIACFNFMNISIVSASKRLKEIGLRKSIGGVKSQLVWQFLLENMVLTILSLIIGTLLGKFLFVPWMDNLFGMGIEFNLTQGIEIWLFYLGMLLLLGFASGAYPAFYISSFKPIDIFGGRLKIAGKNRFTKGFLTLQFILSLIAIVSGIVFMQNVDYQKDRDWGYDQDQLYVLQVPDGESFRMMKNVVAQNPNVVSVTGSANHVGRSFALAVIDKDDKKFEVRRLDVGPDYIESMGLRLVEGRTFDENLKTDEQSVIVNETFVNNIGWDQIIDNTFTFDSTEYSIIGIVEDYHYDSFWNKIEPAMLRLVPDDNFRFVLAEISGGTAVETTAYFEQVWKEQLPDIPFNGYFQDTVFDNYFNQISGHTKLIGFSASLAIVLSCLGLFGLVSLNVTAKKKDFSIRKVLGAGNLEMAKGVNQQYIWILIIATIIGAPLSYFVMVAFLDSVYEYHVPVTIWSISTGVVLIFIVAFTTVSSLVVQVIRDNPVDALRTE
jgi:putative ABC transport system permease protein